MYVFLLRFSARADHHSLQLPSVPIDPLIMDSPTEFDSVLSTQQVMAAARHVCLSRSEKSTSSSLSELDTPDPTSSKPKLYDALSHLMLSPKRPSSPALRHCPTSPSHMYAPVQRAISSPNWSKLQRPQQSHQLMYGSPLFVQCILISEKAS